MSQPAIAALLFLPPFVGFLFLMWAVVTRRIWTDLEPVEVVLLCIFSPLVYVLMAGFWGMPVYWSLVIWRALFG